MNKEKINILLLDESPKSSQETFIKNDFTNIEYLSQGLEENELCEKITNTHILGIRSKTKVSEKALHAAKNLLAIGRFGIGVNNVDLEAAKNLGIPVFNAPFASTRSVAELVIANIFNLMRGIPDKNTGAHQKKWLKSPKNAFEIKNKNLGIIGYSNIGKQISIMAEALGMNIYYYDVIDQLPIGKAQKMNNLEELLKISDVITIHVPGLPSTENLISKKEFEIMKDGSYLINTSRGTIINEDDTVDAIKSGKLAGAALDVFWKEPKKKDEIFESPFQGLKNLILTPHIAGSTKEAQIKLGEEVTQKLINLISNKQYFSSLNISKKESEIFENRYNNILNK